MPTLSFTPNLLRHLPVPPAQISGSTVREVLQGYFKDHPQVRSYVLDDQGEVRKHIAIFLNQEIIRDRIALGDAVRENDEILVMQALSGG